MMAEQVEISETSAKVQIEKVANGYIVYRYVELPEPVKKEGVLGMMREVDKKLEQFVFGNLAEAVAFVGKHYKEPVTIL